MHLVPVRANVTKLSMALPLGPDEGRDGSAGQREGGRFLPYFFEKLLKILDFFKSVLYAFGVRANVSKVSMAYP